ncbi:MAG: hypothetical protein ACPIOQ_72215, partial [Promethearchaeia archaeon]
MRNAGTYPSSRVKGGFALAKRVEGGECMLAGPGGRDRRERRCCSLACWVGCPRVKAGVHVAVAAWRRGTAALRQTACGCSRRRLWAGC